MASFLLSSRPLSWAVRTGFTPPVTLPASAGQLLFHAGTQAAQREVETNVLGRLQLSQTFRPVLARQGSGATLDVLSVLSWVSVPGATPFSVSKVVACSLIKSLRHGLQAQGTQVPGLRVVSLGTSMSRGVQRDKIAPEEVVCQARPGCEADLPAVLADAVFQQVHAELSATPSVYF